MAFTCGYQHSEPHYVKCLRERSQLTQNICIVDKLCKFRRSYPPPPLRETRLTCVAHHMLNVVYYQRHGIYFYYIYYICVLYTSKCISLYIYVYIYIYICTSCKAALFLGVLGSRAGRKRADPADTVDTLRGERK